MSIDKEVGHCNYPWKTIPDQTGEDAPLKSYCTNAAYAVFPNEECVVTCKSNPNLSETYRCVGDDNWELVTPSVTCNTANDSHDESPEMLLNMLKSTINDDFWKSMLQLLEDKLSQEDP